jgi:hypothetical protein
VAFVLGYENARRYIEVPSDPPQDVSTPAHVAFACGSHLPKAYEAFWAVQTDRFAGLLNGPVLVQVAHGPGLLTWSVNRKTLFSERGEGAKRKLARLGLPDPPDEGAGSITVHAEKEVSIDSIEVNVFLRELWVDERIQAMARAELEKLLAGPAAPVPEKAGPAKAAKAKR